MSTTHKLLALGVAVVLNLPTAAVAQELGFSYLEGGFMVAFANDVEDSGAISSTGSPLELESDADAGGFIAGAFQVGENFHLFGDYSSVGQELEVRGGSLRVEGEFDVVRWRVGVGYAYPVSPEMSLYGRLSLDNAEFKDVEVAGFNLNADADESGLGGEVGILWAATPSIHLQGHLRYTSVGEVDTGGSDTFDDDILVGVNGRWYFRPDLALVTGYEFGNITSFNVGLRYAF